MGIVEKKYIDRKIIIKTRILAIMVLVLAGILIYHIVRYPQLFWATAGVVTGGYFLGRYIVLRIKAFEWDEKTLKVVTKFDKVGKIVLAFYVVFAVLRKWIFEEYFQGTALTQVILASVTGIILGRIFGTRAHIKKAFFGKENKSLMED